MTSTFGKIEKKHELRTATASNRAKRPIDLHPESPVVLEHSSPHQEVKETIYHNRNIHH